MTKVEWEEAYKELSKIRSELVDHEQEYNHGSNKKKRANADRQMEYKKHTVKYIFRKYPEVYTLASGGEGVTDFDRIIVMEEFFRNHYIVGDLGKLIGEIQEIINSYDNEKESPTEDPRGLTGI